MTVRTLVALTLLLCAPAWAQEREEDAWWLDDEEEEYARREQLAEAERLARHVARGESDEGECALAVWRWRLAEGARAREAVVRLVETPSSPELPPASRALLAELVDPPPLPALPPEAMDEAGLAALLVAPPGETALQRAVRSARFTRGLDRVSLPAALERLDPAHPWVKDVRARWAREAPAFPWLEELAARAGLAYDPATAERVQLLPRRGHVDVGDVHPGDGWVLERRPDGVLVVDDLLRRRLVPLDARAPALAPADVDADLGASAIPADGWTTTLFLSLAVRGHGAGALHAWWALRRGRAWTAVRILASTRLDEAEDARRADAERTSQAALDLAASLHQAALVRLSHAAPRAEVLAELRRALAVLALAPADASQLVGGDLQAFRTEVADLARGLAAQDEALIGQPPPPAWAEWQRLSPAERLPHLLRALPDCDGDPTDRMGFGGGDAWRAGQRVPADAPERRGRGWAWNVEDDGVRWFDWTPRRTSGRSAADGLVDLGEAAIPALIEALTDESPTRCVRSSRGDGEEDAPLRPLTVGECAESILRAIVDLEEEWHDLWKQPGESERDRQLRARAWWEARAAKGGLLPMHLASLLRWCLTPAPGCSEVGSLGWFFEHASGQETAVVRELVRRAREPWARAQWLRELGRAPHAGYDPLLIAALDDRDPEVVFAATEALLQRGDRRGLARVWQLAAQGGDVVAGVLEVLTRAGEPGVVELARRLLDDPRSDDLAASQALHVLAEAKAPDAGALALRLSRERPECDHVTTPLLVATPPSRARSLALARLASRSTDWQALEGIAPLTTRQRWGRGPGPDREATLRRALTDALGERPDAATRGEVVVVAARVGPATVAALESSTGLALRDDLRRATLQPDARRRAEAVAAIASYTPAELRWVHGRPAETLAGAERLVRTALGHTVAVDCDDGASPAVALIVGDWLGRPVDLDELPHLVEAWERSFPVAMVLVIEWPADDGPRVTVRTPEVSGEGGWLLDVEASGAGLSLRSSRRTDERPSVAGRALLDELVRGLAGPPPRRLRLHVERAP